MAIGYIIKSMDKTAIDLDKINQFTRRNFTKEEIYAFDVLLCDNDVDRDFECFSVEALNKLSYLFVGKTGIFNHDPKGENQTARIYDTKVLVDDSKKSVTGEEYTYLLGKAYMVRNEKNKDLIMEIDGGIKKEVSVSCTAKSRVCSICGKDKSLYSCEHKLGKTYNNKLCYGILSEITDAYEWSFVAIPAQKNAGILKSKSKVTNGVYEKSLTTKQRKGDKVRDIKTLCKAFCEDNSEEITLCSEEISMLKNHLSTLNKKASLGEQYIKSVQDNVLRLGFLSENNIESTVLTSVVSKMSLDELLAFEKAYKLKLEKQNGDSSQLSVTNENQNKLSTNNMFKI